MTEEEDLGDCLGQGTAGAGLISAANLDIGLQKYFNRAKSDELNKTEEVAMLGKVRIQPIALQDDIGSICENIEMAFKDDIGEDSRSSSRKIWSNYSWV